MLKQLLLTTAVALMLGTPVLAQDSATPEATGAANAQLKALPHLVGTDHRAQQSVLSPDGTMIAWAGGGDDQGICVLRIATSDTLCTPLDAAGGKSPADLAWSPDSQSIAYSDNFFIYLLESDIHVFDVAGKTFRNVTDDQSTASPLDGGDKVPADYLPLWAPDGSLYFWRSLRPDAGPTLELDHLATLDGPPETVRDYTSTIPGSYSVAYQPAISADGSKMAVIVMQSNPTAPNNGIYVIDLKTKQVTLIATLNQLHLALPSWFKPSTAFPMSINWAGSNLVVNLFSTDFASLEPPYAVYLDVATKKVLPIFTFSAYKTPVDYVNGSQGGQTADAPIPLPGAGIPTPDGKQFLFVHRLDQETVEVASLPLPPDGSPATALATTSLNSSPAARENTISADGKTALIFDYLLTLGD